MVNENLQNDWVVSRLLSVKHKHVPEMNTCLCSTYLVLYEYMCVCVTVCCTRCEWGNFFLLLLLLLLGERMLADCVKLVHNWWGGRWQGAGLNLERTASCTVRYTHECACTDETKKQSERETDSKWNYRTRTIERIWVKYEVAKPVDGMG